MSTEQWRDKVYVFEDENDPFTAFTAFERHKLNGERFPRTRKGKGEWNTQASHYRTGLSSSTQNDIDPFQYLLSKHPETRIVFFSSITNTVLGKLAYEGDKWMKPDIETNPNITDDKMTAWFLHHEGSYYWIKSIGGYMRGSHGNSGQKFCPLCFEWVREKFQFHKCSAFRLRCYECGTTQIDDFKKLQSHRDQEIHSSKICEKCGRSMAGGNCYERHKIFCKEKSKQFLHCQRCNVTYGSNFQHFCSLKYCKKCRIHYYKKAEHRCFMTRDKNYEVDDIDYPDDEYFDIEEHGGNIIILIPEKNEEYAEEDNENDECEGRPGNYTLFISENGKDYKNADSKCSHYAYDIECRLEPVLDGEGNEIRLEHVVCLVMVTSLALNAEILTFYNLQTFFTWVFRKERGKCTFWAHNAKGYDNRILFNYLCNDLKMSPKCLWQGSKILQMSVKSRKFKDSLCHVPRALRQWPQTLDLKDSFEKGYFPHKFNTSANQGYVGCIPAMEYFEPEKMKEKDASEFLSWYQAESVRVGEKWNLQKELEKYCRSDVRVLKEGLIAYDKLMRDLNENISPLCCVTIAQYAMKVYRNLNMPVETICELTQEEYRFCKDAFRGGRTDVRCLKKSWSEEDCAQNKYGVYVDIQSMYPCVQYYDEMPCGKPEWNFFDDNYQPTLQYLETFNGIISCDIEPKQYLYHPIIGKTDSKTKKFTFTLLKETKITLTSNEDSMKYYCRFNVKGEWQENSFSNIERLFSKKAVKFGCDRIQKRPLKK